MPKGHSIAAQRRKASPVPLESKPCIGPICRGRKTFLSEGPGHRVCERCRRRISELCRTYSPRALRDTDAPPDPDEAA